MSYSAWFEGAALIQLNGLPPDAFDALVQRVVELVDQPWTLPSSRPETTPPSA